MIIHIFIGLLILGGAAFLYRGVRFQNFFLYPAILVFGYIGWIFYNGWANNITDFYSFPWLSSKYYPVNLDFFSKKEIYEQLFPFFVISVISGLYVISNKQERQKLSIIALISLNLAAIIMLVCGQNTLQILVATCFIDVLGFCAISDITARRQYIFYNVLADLGLFTAFTMLWGESDSNQLQMLVGKNVNNISLFLITTSIMLKAGIFPFQGYYLQMITINDSRCMIISYLSTPIAGFFILLKVIPLIAGNIVCFHILSICTILSLIWNTLGGLFSENQNSKKIYSNLIFYALAFFIILTEKGQGIESLGKLFVLHLLLKNILHSGRKYRAVQYIAVMLIISATILIILNAPQTWFRAYLFILMLVTGSILYQNSTTQTQIEGQDVLSLIIAGSIASYMINEEIITSHAFWGYFSFFIALLVGYPYHWMSDLKISSTMEIWSKLLHLLFVAPIEFLGRILWLTIDFLIIERTFLNDLSKCCTRLQIVFERVHRLLLRNAFLFWLLGGAIISYCVYGEKLLWK